MLLQLNIKNVAVIDSAAVEFGDGFNVLTGETAAGKSILIDSINMVLGERTSRDLIRHGTDKAMVEAIFAVPDRTIIEELGIETEDDTVLLRRELSSDGRNTCRINGQLATAAMLKEVARGLINIHGQHDSQQLLMPAKHIDFLDSYADCKSEKEEYYKEYKNNIEIIEALEALKTDQSEKERRIDMLAYQIDEIENAKLSLGEDEELETEREYLSNIEKINEAVHSSYDRLYNSERSVHNILSIVKKSLESVSGYNKELEGFYSAIDEIGIKLDDVVYQIREYSENTGGDTNDLDRVEYRLDLIDGLKRKYGRTIEEILGFFEDAKKQLSQITNSEKLEYELNERLKQSNAELKNLGDKLTAKRTKAAHELEGKIMNELAGLEMSKVRFAVEIEPCGHNTRGADKIEFLIATNAGEPLKPLAKIASGGELSRIMLAIKAILAESDMVETLIFDEIDTGISGRTAHKTAKKMLDISAKKQIICITHLAQIACMASSHFVIKKHVENDRTRTEVALLDTEGRVMELARIMGGEEITPLMIENAKEMLKGTTNV